MIKPSARSITPMGLKFFKKGQLQGRLKQLNLEQDPDQNKIYQGNCYKIKSFFYII